MLHNLHVITNKSGTDQTNFFEQEIYSQNEFAEACLDVQLLLQKGFCKRIENDKKDKDSIYGENAVVIKPCIKFPTPTPSPHDQKLHEENKRLMEWFESMKGKWVFFSKK